MYARNGTVQFSFPQGGVSLNPGAGTFNAIVDDNTFTQVMHADGGLGQLTITADENGTSQFIGKQCTFDKPMGSAGSYSGR